jgi:hypothetical protein
VYVFFGGTDAALHIAVVHNLGETLRPNRNEQLFRI